MITLIGERLILSLLMNKGKDVKYFSVGNNAQLHKKTIQELGSEILRTEPVKQFDFLNNSIEFMLETTSEKIQGVNEMGLFTKDNELICYETFEAFNFPDFTDITLKMSIALETEELCKNWKTITDKINIYAKKTNNIFIKGVYSKMQKTGYLKTDNMLSMELTEHSYFFNQKEGVLYVHCKANEHPNDLEIYVRE